jgi:hypothetical protein
MDDHDAFVSKLPKGPARFLAETLDHALVNGRRSAGDFIRHFPPSAIMTALDGAPNLRATFLITLVGLKERTALRTSSQDAGRMLQNALEEGDTDADSVVTLFSPDDRIQYLEARRVWTFLLEGEFWKAPRSKDGGVYKIAQAHIAFMLDRAIAHKLLTYENVIEGVTIDMIAEKLPRNDMARIFKGAITAGRTGKPFSDADLYTTMTSATLVDYVPLPHVMQTAILPMAQAVGFVDVQVPKPPTNGAATGKPGEGGENAEPWTDSVPGAG